LFLESIIGEWWPGDVAAEPLEASPVARGNRNVRVRAHAAILGHAIRCFGVRDIFDVFVWLHTVAEAPPRLAAMGAGRDARTQRCCGKESE